MRVLDKTHLYESSRLAPSVPFHTLAHCTHYVTHMCTHTHTLDIHLIISAVDPWPWRTRPYICNNEPERKNTRQTRAVTARRLNTYLDVRLIHFEPALTIIIVCPQPFLRVSAIVSDATDIFWHRNLIEGRARAMRVCWHARHSIQCARYTSRLLISCTWKLCVYKELSKTGFDSKNVAIIVHLPPTLPRET